MIILRTTQGRGIFAAALLFLLGACSSQQIYDSSQGWRQNECNKMVDADKQRQCLEQANKPYDSYERERQAQP